MAKLDSTEIDEQIAASIKKFSMLAKDGSAPGHAVIDMPDFVDEKAQLISAHFLLPAGARVADMGCGKGEVTYMIAVLNPRAEIIGVDADSAAIAFAQENYKLPNLSFVQSDVSIPGVMDESLDGIINSNLLYYVYSRAGYDTGAVSDLLEQQTRKLKTGGMMLIRDYVMPPVEDMVLIEFPDTPGRGSDPRSMSDADLLVSFSQTARPMENGYEGFFIEELPPQKEGTRLFRLPHKWAKEFIHRKDFRSGWEKELKEEYTFFTLQDYRRELMRLGMRMAYSAPYWNPWVVKKCFKGRFQLYTEDGAPMPAPSTNHFIVAQKSADSQCLMLEERRPSQKEAADLQFVAVRDKKSGQVYEMVKRAGEHCDIIPYRITPDNRLVVYVRNGYPRPVINAVARGGQNLDGKKWSGHLIEPVSMPLDGMTRDVDSNRRMIFDHMQKYTGLRAKADDKWHVGRTWFPAPDRIDEAVEPVFIEVENPQRTSWPVGMEDAPHFTSAGTMTELDGVDIMHAAHVGLLPEPRLEMHVLHLLLRHNIPMPHWMSDPLPEIPRRKVKGEDIEDILKDAETSEFEEVKGGPKHLRAVRSVFVEEGKVGRSMRGLSAHDVEFFVTDEGVENIAVVLPLVRDWDNNLLVEVEPVVLPAPNRAGGKEASINAPSFPMPRNVKNMDEARAFVAQKFDVPAEHVVALGESYFVHTSLTPQRIYPFAVTSPGAAATGPRRRYMQESSFIKMMNHPRHFQTAAWIFKAFAYVAVKDQTEHGQAVRMDLNNHRYKSEYQMSGDSAALPSRVLGQREDVQLQAAPVKQAATPFVVKMEVVAEKPVPVRAMEAKIVASEFTPPQVTAPAARPSGRLSQSYAQAQEAPQKMEARVIPPVTEAAKPVAPKLPELKPPAPRMPDLSADPSARKWK